MSTSKTIVETAFTVGKDQVSRAFKKMGRNSDKFGKGAENAFKKATKGARRFDKVTKSILQASAIQKSFALLSQGVTQVTADFVSFDDALFSASAKFSDVDLATAKGQETFRKLGKAARETGRITQFTAAQAAQALDFLALAGFNAQQAMVALPGLSDLATAAGIDDFARVVDIASDSLGAFGLATKDTAQLQKNLTRVSDVFAKVQGTTNTNIEALFEAVGKGASTINTTGQSLESFGAIAGVLANSTLKGAEAGTQLRNIMLRLSDPTKQARRVLRRLGVTTSDSKGNFRDIVDVISEFESGLKGMGTQQRAAALSTVFGTRAVTGMGIILKEGAKSLRKWRKGLIDAGGTSKTMAGIMRQSLGNRLKSLGSAASEVGFKFLDAFKVNGVNAIDSFTKALRNIDVQPFVDALTAAGKLLMNIFTLTKSITVLMSPLIAAWIAYKATMIATLVIAKGYRAFRIAMVLIRRGTLLATAAQWAFNAAMTANPIGLIVAGIALAITAIGLLIFKWDVVKKALISGGNAILGIFKQIWKIIKLIPVVGALANIFGGDDKKASSSSSASGAAGSGVFAPPNSREANAGSQKFEGIFKFLDKPDNITFEAKTFGAPLISAQGLGAN